MPGWQASAVEPSANATQYFRRILPQLRIHEGPFDTAPFRDERFDFVAISGVLEHVSDPVGFLSDVRRCVAPGGCAYVGLPNFEAKPDDLVSYDHLTRFTPATLDVLYARTGFRVLRRDERPIGSGSGMPSFRRSPLRLRATRSASLRPARPSSDTGPPSRMRVRSSRACSPSVRPTGSRAALFGLGVQGLLELSLAGARGKPVRFLLDDNPHVWGTRRLGLEIRGSQQLPSLGVEAVYLAANPCYHPRMRAKLEAVGIRPDRIYG